MVVGAVDVDVEAAGDVDGGDVGLVGALGTRSADSDTTGWLGVAVFVLQPTASQPISPTSTVALPLTISPRSCALWRNLHGPAETQLPSIGCVRQSSTTVECLISAADGYRSRMVDFDSCIGVDGEVPRLVLGGRYSLLTRIAVGGMGEVWSAMDDVLGREVAVKILRAELVDSSDFLERFRVEAKRTAALTHAGIASVFDYGEEEVDGVLKAFLVMELVHGDTLSLVLSRRGPLDVTTTLSVLVQSADALDAAHQSGIVHRDVKPGNLLLLKDGTVKLTDFGIARAMNSVAVTQVGQVIGTAQYMSPEQALGRDATAASDVYSLAVIGYEMLAGRAPFTGSTPAALAMAQVNQFPPPLPETVPNGVRSLIERSLAKDPADRPRDAGAFAAEARRLQRSVGSDFAATAVMATQEAGPATEVMPPTASAGPATKVMPPTAVLAGSSPRASSDSDRHEKRRGKVPALFALVAVAIIGAAALASSSTDPKPPPTDGSIVATSVPIDPSATTVVVNTVAPTTPTTSVAPGSKEHGPGNGKGKPKD